MSLENETSTSRHSMVVPALFPYSEINFQNDAQVLGEDHFEIEISCPHLSSIPPQSKNNHIHSDQSKGGITKYEMERPNKLTPNFCTIKMIFHQSISCRVTKKQRYLIKQSQFLLI